jgi:hypothetical protein
MPISMLLTDNGPLTVSVDEAVDDFDRKPE